MSKQETVIRAIKFPKELKEYLDNARKSEMRSFVAEVVYRVKKSVEEEMNAKTASNNQQA